MKFRLFYFFVLLIVLVSCQKESGVRMDASAKPFEKLSQYQFFTGKLNELTPNELVLPYNLNTPLFSDYAQKARFVWMPEGTTASIVEENTIDFPVGSVLIKNFYFNNDETDANKGQRIIETRLLIHRKEKWDAITYIWNKEQTEAYLDVVGDIVDVEWKNKAGNIQKVNYIIPNKNQCKGCHSYDNKLLPLGPKVRNLNKEYAYQDGTTNQLLKWREMGYLNPIASVETLPKVPVWNDSTSGSLHNRAMAYLDVNCGHCHNPKGPAYTSGLNLIYDEPLSLTLGIRKTPVAAGKGSGGHDYSILPGHPEKSILVYRMKSDDPGARMPELGRTAIHKEGVDLISEWIAAMEE